MICPEVTIAGQALAHLDSDASATRRVAVLVLDFEQIVQSGDKSAKRFWDSSPLTRHIPVQTRSYPGGAIWWSLSLLRPPFDGVVYTDGKMDPPPDSDLECLR